MSTKAILLGTSLGFGIGSSIVVNSFITPYDYRFYILNDTIYNAY